MRPIDVSSRDWALYYNNTIMDHSSKGVVQVNVSDRVLYTRKNETNSWVLTSPEELTCLWPRACAINWNNNGIYVARRSRREARRSASCNHYYITYATSTEIRSVSSNMLAYLCFPNEYPTIDFAYEALITMSRLSIAISPELILTQAQKGCFVIYKATTAGILIKSTEALDNASYLFQPDLDNSPAAKRAAFRLQKEGILCH